MSVIPSILMELFLTIVFLGCALANLSAGRYGAALACAWFSGMAAAFSGILLLEVLIK